MKSARLFLLTCTAMLAFAGNSLLCRAALKQTAIDAASFTFIRLFSGAVVLLLVVRLREGATRGAGSWPSAVLLFLYAAAFSFAYVKLPAASGALLLFGAVQATMIFAGLLRGETLRAPQILGLALAIGGLVALFLPGLSAPPLRGSILMLTAGFAWGIYSLRGQGAADPAGTTAGNFLRAVPLAVALSGAFFPWARLDVAGAGHAVLSGALCSGLGYVVWYAALPALKSTSAAVVQLSVPVLAAAGGIVLLGEPITSRFVVASIAILGGIALVIWEAESKSGLQSARPTDGPRDN